MFKGYTHSTASTATPDQVEALERLQAKKNAGPAGGLLIAVGTSLVLWAVIAEAAKLASHILF